jgi:DNA-binding winged helix-turn-helix (wHTH) protein
MIRFGSFQIDPRTWLLLQHGSAIELSPRLVEILGYIVARDGEIVTKDELLERFWPGVNVTENTLTRAIADIRKAIGDDAAKPKYLETASRRGYRLAAGAAGAAGATGAAGAKGAADAERAQTDPFEEWVKGRLALDSLDSAKLEEAVRAFERTAAELPRYAPAHAGLANAYMLQYEKTRSGRVPDRALLERAMKAAREASTIDPSLGEAWAVLGYLLCAAGKMQEGQAAARRATALEPDNWRHHYRLAYGAWGEERLRAVDRTLALMPGFAPARMLACMVFVARGTIDRAEREASLGADAQRQHHSDRTPLPAVGHHWLRGMILGSQGDRNAALACFDEEIAAASSGHVYASEFAVNAHVASGFTHLSTGNLASASEAFAHALSQSAGHPKANVGSYAIATRSTDQAAIERARDKTAAAIEELLRADRQVEAALVTAGKEIVEGRISEAIATLDRLLATAPAGPAGWIIPVDPMLAGIRENPGKQALFAKLAARAS